MRINKLTKVMVDILFYAGIVCVICVPFLARQIVGFYGFADRAVPIYIGTLLVSGVLAVYILYNLKMMFRTLLGANPFVAENVHSLKKIALSSAAIALVYIIKAILLFSWAAVIIAIVFSVGYLFSMTLKNIFEQAIEYKQENDLTI